MGKRAQGELWHEGLESEGGKNGYIELAEVGLLFASHDLQGGGLSNTVGPHQSKHLTRTRGRKSVHSKWGVSVRKV